MVENPIVTKERQELEGYQHKFRDENPKKFLGTALFIIKGFKNQSERINVEVCSQQQAIKERNGFSESLYPHFDPDNSPIKREVANHQFRGRDASKDINPEMKFGLSLFRPVPNGHKKDSSVGCL